MSFEQNNMKHLHINLENYEEYFLLYVDNELTEAEKKDVEFFIEQHPELREEWTMLMDTRLEPEHIMMNMKQDLYRDENNTGINELNYEEFQLSWLDKEICEKDALAIETYTNSHPSAAANFELLSKTKLSPEDVRFPDKSLLYRSTEKPAAVISIKWYRMAVAAAILIAAGLWFINKPEEDEIQAAMVTVAQQVPKENKEAPVTDNKENKAEMEEKNIDNDPAENVPETKISSATRVTVNDRLPATRQPSKAEDNAVAAPGNISRNNIEIVPRGNIDEVVNMGSDPMVAANPITAKPVHNLDVKSDYATEALARESNGNIPDQPDVMEDDKPRKGMFRGIVRKANRIYNKVTNPDPEKAIVKVANFEIGLPR
jgi:hypothetical protein